MSAILARIQELVAKGEVRVSEHGYDELAARIVSMFAMRWLAWGTPMLSRSTPNIRKALAYWSWKKMNTASRFM